MDCILISPIGRFFCWRGTFEHNKLTRPPLMNPFDKCSYVLRSKCVVCSNIFCVSIMLFMRPWMRWWAINEWLTALTIRITRQQQQQQLSHLICDEVRVFEGTTSVARAQRFLVRPAYMLSNLTGPDKRARQGNSGKKTSAFSWLRQVTRLRRAFFIVGARFELIDHFDLCCGWFKWLLVQWFYLEKDIENEGCHCDFVRYWLADGLLWCRSIPRSRSW